LGLVLDRAVFGRLRDALPAEVKVIFTNGCFDLLHRGHLHILQHARTLGDILVVGVNSDSSVARLKGPGRPVLPEQERARTLAELWCVDFVILFDELDPVETIKVVRPHLHVKGGDYDLERMPETPVVRSLGGEVVLVPLVEGYSTTEIIQRLRGASAAEPPPA
jgi:rfaE bifunctional protein nucleotidyltransferase chain/domain